jgi:hypothetical protein
MEISQGVSAMQTADILHTIVQLAPYLVGITAIAFVWWPGRHERSEEDIAEARKQTALLERISAKLEQSH